MLIGEQIEQPAPLPFKLIAGKRYRTREGGVALCGYVAGHWSGMLNEETGQEWEVYSSTGMMVTAAEGFYEFDRDVVGEVKG